MRTRPIIFWFRNDLRLGDHPALTAAVRTGAPIIPLYILDEDAGGRWKAGSASRWWLAKSLEALGRDIALHRSRLILRRGETVRELKRIVEETDAQAVYASRRYDPSSVDLEAKLHKAFSARDIGFKRFGGVLLREPEEVRNGSGEPYNVFTPFWRAFRREFAPSNALPAPEHLTPVSKQISSDCLSDWNLLPTKPDWSGGLADTWTPGEAGAQSRLRDFVSKALPNYDAGRDRPAANQTSRLSPYFAFGEISPASCWRAVSGAASKKGASDLAIETFLKELAWREFSYSLLFRFPEMPDEPLRKEFASIPWEKSQADLKAWQQGMTGYPIVDAGMRELWATGYMHNRVRMITASFLTKHLLLPWKLGEMWFWDTLVDADLASNATNWQWVAGSGVDAAPYFRIFNPVLQGEKFDPDGDYVRRWVPELARLPASIIHAPWTADADELKNKDVVIGETYPAPIVDHKTARQRALAAYESLKTTNG